jgi:hypothetical protein
VGNQKVYPLFARHLFALHNQSLPPGPIRVRFESVGFAYPDGPEVLHDVDLELTPDGTVTVAATLCSAYDTPERYADAWRVLTPDGEELAVRELTHDHAAQQPFTRSLPAPIAVPGGVTSVVIEGRDLVNGWGGATLEVSLPDA